MRTIWRAILSQNELNTSWMLFHSPGYQGRATQNLIRGTEKWSSQEATLLGGIQKRRGISQAWRSYSRSKGLKPHTGHPSLGFSTRKWAPFPDLKTNEAYRRVIENQDPVLKTRKTDWPAPDPTQKTENCPMLGKAFQDHRGMPQSMQHASAAAPLHPALLPAKVGTASHALGRSWASSHWWP